jgi:uncharacterized protein YukE
MSRRPGHWSLVGYADDPVPADGQDVAGVARTMRDRATDVRNARSQLQRLSHQQGWKGQAGREFAKKAAERVDDLQKVSDRYQAAADALNPWAAEVSHARAATYRALQDATEADATARSLTHHYGATADPVELHRRQVEAHRRDEALARLNRARRAAEGAIHELGDAARRTAGRLHDAGDIFKDSPWDKVKKWVRDHAEFLKALVTVLSLIAILVAILCGGWIALLVIGLAVLLIDALMMASEVPGVGWLDIGLDIVSIATLGVGRLVGPALKGAVAGAKGTAAAKAAAEAAGLAKNGTKIGFRFFNGSPGRWMKFVLREGNEANDASRFLRIISKGHLPHDLRFIPKAPVWKDFFRITPVGVRDGERLIKEIQVLRGVEWVNENLDRFDKINDGYQLATA